MCPRRLTAWFEGIGVVGVTTAEEAPVFSLPGELRTALKLRPGTTTTAGCST